MQSLAAILCLASLALLCGCATGPDQLSDTLQVQRGWGGESCVTADVGVPSTHSGLRVRRNLGCVYP